MMAGKGSQNQARPTPLKKARIHLTLLDLFGTGYIYVPHPNSLNAASSNLPGTTQSIHIPWGPSSIISHKVAAHVVCVFSEQDALVAAHTCLQGELQKSKEMGTVLQHLTGAFGDIHDILSGSAPQTFLASTEYSSHLSDLHSRNRLQHSPLVHQHLKPHRLQPSHLQSLTNSGPNSTTCSLYFPPMLTKSVL